VTVFVQTLIIASAVGLLVVIGWAVYATRRERRRRMAMLDAARDRLDGATVSRSPWRYPRIDGTFEGAPVRVDLVTDSMVRKGLPCMWAQITWQRPHAGSLYVTVDPRAGEYLKETDIHDRRRFQPPDDWPDRLFASGDDEIGVAMLAAVAGFDPGAHPRLKQIAITTDDITVTVRAARARRPHRVFYASEVFANDPIDARVIDEGLAILSEVESLLAAAPNPHPAETHATGS